MGRAAPLRELTHLVKCSDADGLRALLQEGPEPLALLGLPARNLEALLSRPDSAFVTTLRQRLEVLRGCERKRATQAARRVAEAGATELAARARWSEQGVYLERTHLFGPLLADRRAKYIAFQLEEQEIPIRRDLLSRARDAMKPFKDLTVFLDSCGLHLRWRKNKGGLNLTPQPLRTEDRSTAICVVLTPPKESTPSVDPVLQPQPIIITPQRIPRPSISGSWLAAVIDGLMSI